MRALLVTLLLWAPWPLAAQSVLRVDPRDQPSTDRVHYLAETGCHPDEPAPYSQQLRALTAETAAENAIHEAVHRRQLAGNCDSVMAVWDTNIVARVDAEAEAFCEGMTAGNVPRSWQHARMVRAAAWWARFTLIGYDRAIAAYERWCGA